MKTTLTATLVALSALTIASTASAKPVALDAGQSKIRWTGKKVTGAHNGTIALKSGNIDVEGTNIKGGTVEIDMASIVNEDVKDPANNAKLTGHLKSDDFFGVDKHPTSVFKITSVQPAKDKKAGTHDITGDLTIKGVTHPVTFPATVTVKGDKASAKGKIVIDRTKYNIRYGSGKFFENLGDKMINDEFELDLDVKSKG